MIVFDLKCAHGHVFEAWFNSSAGYAEQRESGLVACPVCDDRHVEKAVMAPNVGAKGNQKVAAASAPSTPNASPEATVARALAMLADAQAKMLKQSQWVGAAFTDRARAMHDGTEEVAAIHGQATPDQARALAEEGVPVMPLLVPVVPPDQVN